MTTSKLQRAVVCAIGALREGVLLVAPLAGKGFVFLHVDSIHKNAQSGGPLWVLYCCWCSDLWRKYTIEFRPISQLLPSKLSTYSGPLEETAGGKTKNG